LSFLTPVNPAALGVPRGYANGMLAPAGGRLLFVAGQVAWDAEQRIVCDDIAGQFGKALDNVLAVVREAGGGPGNVARLTFFVTVLGEYMADLKAVGEAYRRVMGKHFPAMALFEVKALVDPRAKVEVEATAVLGA
jgi:enamine deaminase RidA (YjgF/YER057c/UK114 family)